MKAPSYGDLLESSLNPKPKFAEEEKTDSSIFAGWVCTGLCLVVPIFIVGSIICGIKAIEKGYKRDGVLIMCLAPVASLIGSVIIWLTVMSILGMVAASVMKDSQEQAKQMMEEMKRSMPAPYRAPGK